MRLDEWLRDGKITHDLSHVHTLDRSKLPAESAALGAQLADDLKYRKAIMGIFDEGCMGMYNAIIDDELLNPAGIFKERLSQSALVAKMRTVTDAEARGVYDWLVQKGVQVCFRQGCGDRADAGAGARAVQDVHRGGAHCHGLWLRRDRHSVSAGLEGHGARVGPGRRDAEQCRAASGVCRGHNGRAVMRAGRWCTSTKWTNAPAPMR